METTRDTLFSRWNELKGQVQHKWTRLTDEDLDQLSGKTEELVVALQRRYGYGKVQAEIEIQNWLREYNKLPNS